MKKEYILKEIRRTAEANGGVPLGQQKFAHETGIKESDWSGKLWARWGDAVREAGLAPNRLKTAYNEEFLFEKYIELARELHHLPSKNELRLKARSSPGFPAHTTFNRFGAKSEFVKRLAEYCRSRDEYQDVVLFCDEYIPQTKSGSVEPSVSDAEIGVVYLIKSGRYYKIGRTNAAGRREYELAIQLPEKATTVHEIRTDDPAGIEAYWHKRFAAKWKNGEWFDLTAADVAAFKRRKFM